MQRLSVSLRGVRHCLNPQDLFKAVEASMEKSSRLSDVQNLELLVRGAIWSPKKVFWSLSKSLLRIQWRLWWTSPRSGIWRRRLTATRKGDDCQRRMPATNASDEYQGVGRSARRLLSGMWLCRISHGVVRESPVATIRLLSGAS